MTQTIEEQVQYTLDDLISRYIDNSLIDTHTALPGVIDSFDPETQIAKVQPLIKRVLIDNIEKDLPVLINVPVVFQRAGGFNITFPVQQGDECLILFSERAIDTWLQSGGIQKPLDRRKHDLTDAIALLGLYNQTNVISDFNNSDLVLRSEDNSTKITISSDSIIIDSALETTINTTNANINASSSINVNCPSTTWIGNINLTGNITQTGSITTEGHISSYGILLATHKHINVTAGPDLSGIPTL